MIAHQMRKLSHGGFGLPRMLLPPALDDRMPESRGSAISGLPSPVSQQQAQSKLAGSDTPQHESAVAE